MSKKKQYRNRLNNLFADMGEETAEPTHNGGTGASGWSWECDSNGEYHTCSSEVEAILGVKAAEFLGQPLKTFQLAPESAYQLNETLEKDGELPMEITLHFQSRVGTIVPVRTHIFRHQENGWRGFSQVIEEPDENQTEQAAYVEYSEPAKPPIPPAVVPPTPSVSFSTLGLAIDDDRPISVSSPYSGAGKQSLKQRQTIANPSAPGIEAALAVPIKMSDQTLGLLEIIDTKPNRDWNEDEQRLVEEVASQLALALENAQLFQETQSSLARTDALYRVGQAAIAFEDITELLQSVANTISEVLPANRTLIAVLNQQTEEAIHLIESFQKPTPVTQETYQELMKGLSGWAILEQKPALSNIGTEDHRESDQERAYRMQTDAGSVLVVPMMYREEVFGTVTAINSFNRPGFTQSDVDLLLAMANQVATALANNQLFQQVSSRSQSLQTAAEVSRAASSILDPNPLITETVRLIRERFNLYYVGLFLVDDRGLWTYEPGKWAVLRAGTGEAGRIQVERGHKLEVGGSTMIGRCISKSQPQISQQVQAEEQRFANPLLPETRSEMALPLISRGQVIGAMSIQSTKPTAFSDDDIAILQTMADQVANALQNAYLFDQTQARAEELAVLNEMSRQLTATVDRDTIIRNIYLFSSRLIDTSTFFIALYDERINQIQFPFATENNQEIEIPPRSMGKGMTEYVLKTQSPLLLHEDVEGWLRSQGVDLIPIGSESETDVAQSWMGVPMLAGGSTFGVIGVQHNDPHHYSTQDNDLLVAIASQGAIALQNANLFEQIQQRSEELQLINQVVSQVAASMNLNESLKIIANEIGKAIQADSVGVTLLNENRTSLTVMAEYMANDRINSVLGSDILLDGNPASQQVIMTKNRLVINDPQSNPLTRSSHEILKKRGVETLMILPLTVSGEVIGTVGVDILDKRRTFSESQIGLIETIILQAATAIENTRLFEQTRRQLRDLSMISNASQDLSSAPLDTQGVAGIIARIFIDVLGGHSTATISLRETEMSNQMITITSLRKSGDEIFFEDRIEQWNFNLQEFPATQKVMDTQKPLVVNINDANADPAELAYMDSDNVQQLIIIPLAIKGQSIGIIELEYFEETRPPTADDLNLVLTLANQAAVTLENARLYEEQRATAEQLREIDILKSQFLANMSHELRTPLNSIIGFSRVIMKGIDGPVTDLQQQDLSAIYNAGQHLLNMINDILDISKIEAGKMELAFDDVDIANIIESVLSTARGLVKDKPVKLVTDVEKDIPIISADPTRIRQVLLNLISNASKFTDEGSITVTARKQTSKQGKKEIYIAVTDTGPGIAEEDQNKLFVPFSQVDGSPTRKVGGTGLGLSITRLLVELHGGQIDVISDEGEGSTFWFTIPMPEGSETAEPMDQYTILSIDDDTQVINLYERYLTDVGYKVIAVTNPQEALEEARRFKPFAITLDIMMPNFDSWDLLEKLKSDPDIGQIPVIICSILAEQEKAFQLGATDYLTKPILEDDLVDVLKKLK